VSKTPRLGASTAFSIICQLVLHAPLRLLTSPNDNSNANYVMSTVCTHFSSVSATELDQTVQSDLG
jgi:hypothetical protein